MTQTIDQNLIDSCRKGDRKAQRVIYDLLAPKMYSLCLRYVADRYLAQDLLQDGFVTLFTKIDSYKGDGSFEGWARKVFVNICLMSIRKKDVLKESEDISEAWSIQSENTSAIQDIGYKELMKLIEQMPVLLRAVFNLSVVEGYSHKEIAIMLNMTEGNSRSSLSRGRAWLQKRIFELKK